MIWNFCIARPVFTIVAFLVLAIFGLFGYLSMPVRENPDIEFPVVSVNVVYPGAEPGVIETEIIEPLEEEINTIEGLKQLTSQAQDQVGTVVAEFELWRDIDIAAQDVRDRVSRARRRLPDDVEEPIITKLDPDAQAIMWVTLIGDRRWDSVELTRYADEVLRQRLENLRGVGRIQIGGARRYAVRLTLDPERLAAHHLAVQDVITVLQRNNVRIPSGRIESASREFLVNTRGQFDSPEPINDLIVAYRNDSPVRIGDVGLASHGVENDRQKARFSRVPAVGMGVVRQSDANTVELAAAVRARMEQLKESFPPGITYTIATDESRFIEESIQDLLMTIGIATLLVIGVVLVFLRNLWGTLIAGVAIPTSLLGGAAAMYAMGFSINTLTMLALILAIGIVVDDAIVVLESAYRHIEEGTEPIPAARVGTTEVAFPAIATTVSLAAVFVPVAFTAGLIGRFFNEFGLTVAVTVIFSTITALTLTPMLCSRLLRPPPPRRGWLFRSTEWVFRQMERGYAGLLRAAFAIRFVTLLLAVGMLALGLYLFTQLSTEFMPTADREQFMIAFETPEGATLPETDRYAQAIEAVLAEMPTIRHQFMVIGLSRGGGPGQANEGRMFVRMSPRSERTQHQIEVMQELRERLAQLPGGRAFVVERSMPGVGGAPLQVILQHADLDRLAAGQEQVLRWMRQQREFVGVNTNLRMNQPEIAVHVKRDLANQMDISVADISNTMRYLLGEPQVSEIQVGTERYDVISEVVGKGQMVPAAIAQLYVRSASGALVPLSNLVDLEETIGPSEIHHFNRIRSATLSASTPPGVALGDAVDLLTGYLSTNMPAEFDYEFTGATEDFRESFYYLSLAMGFSVVFIYLVLCAQFESFLHPMTILLSLPLALVGAAGALWLLDLPFGIVAFVGVILLMGMATKNAVLLVDYANVLIARGMPPIEAAQQAARVRLRPVLMTAVSTVFGVLPIALGFGAGGEARAPMGVAVAAGMTTNTLLTLIIVPVVYTLFHQLRERTARAFGYGVETK